MSIPFQEQIRDLEQNLEEERRALMEAERRYTELKQKYEAVIQRAGT
jgi:phage shock protein A